jgi:predicted O-methyltransferase YrrM
VRAQTKNPHHPLKKALAALRAETAAVHGAHMAVPPEQGAFMALLVRLMGAARCVEVGVFTGYSSLSVALVRCARARP